MSHLYPTDWRVYLEILLVFLRAMGLFLLVPGFSHNAIPGHVKILFALSLSLLIHPIVKPYVGGVDNSLGLLAGLALRESMIGFIMGFVGYIICEGTHLAAQFVGYQMGFGTAGLLEPQSQSSVSVMVHLQSWIVLVLFFVTDLHHHVIQLFVHSFSITKNLDLIVGLNANTLKVIIDVSARIFVLAIQLAAPFTLLVLLCNVLISVLARAMPQMNILLFSFPVTIITGLITFYIVAPDMIDYLEIILGDMSLDMMNVLRTL